MRNHILKIEKIPEELWRHIKINAVFAGMSVKDYVLGVLAAQQRPNPQQPIRKEKQP
jgi:hypothetical protein